MAFSGSVVSNLHGDVIRGVAREVEFQNASEQAFARPRRDSFHELEGGVEHLDLASLFMACLRPKSHFDPFIDMMCSLVDTMSVSWISLSQPGEVRPSWPLRQPLSFGCDRAQGPGGRGVHYGILCLLDRFDVPVPCGSQELPRMRSISLGHHNRRTSSDLI